MVEENVYTFLQNTVSGEGVSMLYSKQYSANGFGDHFVPGSESLLPCYKKYKNVNLAKILEATTKGFQFC